MPANYWKQPHAKKTALNAFSSQFFLMTMGTGILAVNLQTLPYQFPALGILSIIVWIFDLVLFIVIASLFATKWISFPSSTLKHFESEAELTMYFSAIAISTSTLLEMLALVTGRTWAGWDVACMVLFYCNVVLALICAVIPYWIAFRMEQVSVENLPPTALYPVTAILSSASAGSVVVTYSSLSVRASLPVVILSLSLTGLGFLTGMAILAAYTARLLQASTPPPKKAMASFIPVAAISNACYSSSSLTRLLGPSRNILAEYGEGYVANEMVGLAFYGAGVAAAIALIGFASWWMLLGALTVLRDAPKAPFTLNYWSSLYPWGVFAIALGQLGQDFDSPTFRTLNTIFTCLLLLNWFFCMAMTIPRLVTGDMLVAQAEETKEHFESWRERKRLHSSDEEQAPESHSQQQDEGQEGERQ